MTSYLDLLLTLGLPAVERGVWASVGLPARDYGWKLHLSSIQTEAPALISRIGPMLRDRGVAFKLAWNDEMLGELNEGTFGATQVGKFATIYPRDDEEAVALARELVAMTGTFAGPRIITDRPLGNIVYTRFGAFNPRYQRDRLGRMRAAALPDGAGYSVPFEAPAGQPDPFAGWPCPAMPQRAGRTIGPGFMLTEAIVDQPAGVVSLALDLRFDHFDVVVMKEGRRFCMSDTQGRHMWDRIRHQHALATRLADQLRVPRARAIFEHGDSLFLAMEHIAGRDLAERPARPLADLDTPARAAMVGDLIALTDTLGALHAAGVVHRDLSPGNVRIDRNGHAWLLDLEMAAMAGEHGGLFAGGRAGFVSPEQAAGHAAAYADDLYALGCLMAFLLTGFDPCRMSLDDDGGLAGRLAALSGGGHPLVDLCAGLLRRDPGQRLSLAQLGSALGRMRAADVMSAAALPEPDPLAPELLHQASRWLTRGGLRDRTTGLPLSPEMPSGGDHDAPAATQAYRLYRSASRGVAGVLYAVARLARVGARDAHAADFAANASAWLLRHHPTDDVEMPGLHFGEAGVALALLEAVRAGLIEHGRWMRPYLLQAFDEPADWPDLSHGAAGQGLAALQAGHLTGIADISAFADRCAAGLIASQGEDGCWRWPAGVAGMEDVAHSGLAHGTAGVVYFLASHARLRNDGRSRDAASRGGAWLAALRRPSPDARFEWWPQRDDVEDGSHWWCHGGPGIAVALLALHEMSGDSEWASLARSALRAHPFHVRHANLGQCHGLAGLGEIYLDAWRILGEGEWLDRARAIGTSLAALSGSRDGMTSWTVEHPAQATADLMIGSGGVAHFLARLHARQHGRIGMPLSIDPDIPALLARPPSPRRPIARETAKCL